MSDPRARRLALLFAAVAAIGLAGLLIGRPLDLAGLLDGDPHARLALGFRWPRVALALVIGGALGVSGAVLQGALRNDLAAPGLLGVQAGGQAAVVLFLAAAPGMLPPLALPGVGFVGAVAAVAVVIGLSSRRGALEPQRVLLVGLAVTMAIGSATSVLSLALPMSTFDFLRAWVGGSLDRADAGNVALLAPWLGALAPLAWSRGHALDALALGEHGAVGVGVSLRRERLGLIALSTALAGACAAVDGGGIAFCGLLAPHIARRLVGPGHRRLIPASMAVGMALVALADGLGRLLPGYDVPAGALVTLLGGPYFLWLLTRR